MINQPADPIDRAAELMQESTAYYIANRAKPPEPLSADEEVGEEDLECPECGDQIPEKRRRAGYTLCVGCAEYFER